MAAMTSNYVCINIKVCRCVGALRQAVQVTKYCNKVSLFRGSLYTVFHLHITGETNE